ncbi:uncharacterized protein LOC127288967 isoform X1 [Leptopilina boulardi]|uniref:uncharacterized protein LOC127288967 isoform X1 n=1 Tax=Leptopilina boulardi TaxID=63433 RepID=UPI0021F63DF2|nr:uncharacterized protein LOC127288967 isoform X1 [Leptopilina boulardi]
MLRFYIILTLTCVFHAKANPIDNLLSLINAELPKILENHDEFSNSIIRSVYALRDSTSDIIFSGPWNATLTLSNILSEAAKTLNQKECIARRQLEWKAKVPSINSDLYKCVYDIIKMGDEIRKNIQNAYEVQGESTSKFQAIINKASQELIKYDDEFFGSIVLSLSKLREITSEIMFRGWNATCTLKTVLMRGNIKTTEQKKCIKFKKTQWIEKLQVFNSNIYGCLFNYREMGNPIRQKFHNAKKEAFEIEKQLSEVKKNCSYKSEQSESQCISDNVKKLEISFENLIKNVTFYKAEAATFRPKIYAQSLICNAKVLDNIYDLSNQFQKKLKNCVL